MANKAVAFIDLLGFSSCVQRDVDEAVLMLSYFNSVLQELNFERAVHPSKTYDNSLQSLARRNSNESFEHFLPFSDSVFVASSNCSDFILQLGSFVRKAFLFNAYKFAHPIKESDPLISQQIEFDLSNLNDVITHRVPMREPVILFRGGIAYGNVIETKPDGLFANQLISCNNMMGEAMVRAVRMEESKIKGPRILFDNSVYEKLNSDAKIYCRVVPEDTELFEILWPALGFILENRDSFTQEMNHFYEIFTPAYNLWKYWRDNEHVSVHYERFLELTVASVIQIYKYMGEEDFITDTIKGVLNKNFNASDINRIFNHKRNLGFK